MKKIPIELYITLLPCFLIFPPLFIFSDSFRIIVLNLISIQTINAMFFGNPLLKWGVITLFIVTVYTIIAHYINTYRANKLSASFSDSIYQKKITDYLIVITMVAGTTLIGGLLLLWVTKNASSDNIAKSSDLLMDLDWKIFGVYPPFWIHKFQNIPALESFLIWSYKNIKLMTSITFVLLLLKDIKLLKKYILAIFLAGIISFPIWISVPAISPVGMYVSDNLNIGVPKEISDYIKSYPVTKRLAINSISMDMSYAVAQGKYSITTFPSMHAAWAVVIAYFIFLIWPPLIIVAVPFLLGTVLGAIYIAQHYAVDILAGFLIAVLAIVITNYVERRYGKIDV